MDNNFYDYQQPTTEQPVYMPVQEEPVIEPDNTLAPKKKLFGKPEIFMIIAVLASQLVLPIIQSIFSALNAGITMLVADIFGLYSADTIPLSTALGTSYLAVSSLLSIALFILLGYLAYKKIRGVARFLGVAFAATSVSSVLSGVASTVIEFFFFIIAALFGYESEIYAILVGIKSVLLIGVFGLISAALAVVLLMIVDGKIKFKKKEKKAEAEAEETAEPVQENI